MTPGLLIISLRAEDMADFDLDRNYHRPDVSVVKSVPWFSHRRRAALPSDYTASLTAGPYVSVRERWGSVNGM